MIKTLTNGVKSVTGFWSKKGYLMIVFGSVLLIVFFAFIAFASGQKGTHDVNTRQLLNMTDKYATRVRPRGNYMNKGGGSGGSGGIGVGSSIGGYGGGYGKRKREQNIYGYVDWNDSPVENGSPRDSRGENQCRRILQQIFNKPFIKSRPNFLRNPITGKYNLELDCYNESLRLACEYNGEQHYAYNKFFHRNKDHFLTQKYRDELKRRMCQDNGVNLIEVPYTVSIPEIEKYLINACRKLNYIQ